MFFQPSEKIFSLSKTASALPQSNLTQLWEEFYCYLLVAGFFREGESDEAVRANIGLIRDRSFFLPHGSYRSGLERFISNGLQQRYLVLIKQTNLDHREKDVLISLDGLFDFTSSSYVRLSASDLLNIARVKQFSNPMMNVAAYVAFIFGQHNFPKPLAVPRLYLSAFGNIHLCQEDMVELTPPHFIYGSKEDKGKNPVTALWSWLSAQTTTLCQAEYPGNLIGDMLSSVTFLTEGNDQEKYIPLPKLANSLYMKRLIGIEEGNNVPASAAFVHQLIYRTNDDLTVSRSQLFDKLLNLMVTKTQRERDSDLFTDNSFYRKMMYSGKIRGKDPQRSSSLSYALESLDNNTNTDTDDDSGDGSTEESDSSDSGDDTTKDASDIDPPQDQGDPPADDNTGSDPQTNSGGFDPTASSPPMADPDADVHKDTMDLVSFDKSGEGVNEDLYRAAVLALNNKLQKDSTVPVEQKVKDQLDHWVNGWLYRTAISATKDQIAFLNLQMYLKTVQPKG